MCVNCQVALRIEIIKIIKLYNDLVGSKPRFWRKEKQPQRKK